MAFSFGLLFFFDFYFFFFGSFSLCIFLIFLKKQIVGKWCFY